MALARVVPVNSSLDQFGTPIYGLMPATIAVVRSVNGTLASQWMRALICCEQTTAPISELTRLLASTFTTSQHRHWVLARAGLTLALASISGVMVGHTVFVLK
jgi:hypothetical protein